MPWTAVSLLLLIALTGGRASAKEAAPFLFGEGRKPAAIGLGLSEETADAPVSLFGHLFAYIATVGDDGRRWPLRLEQGINVAVASDGPLDVAAYRSLPLQRLLHEANSKELRGVWLVEIKLGQSELTLLAEALNQRMSQDVSYDLLRRNCAFYILDWLATVRPGLRTELKWRPVWTPRQAMDAIRRHFELVDTRYIPPNAEWSGRPGTAQRQGTAPVPPEARTEEGVSVMPAIAFNEGRTWSGAVLSLGQRGHGTLPLGSGSTTKLTILELAAFATGDETQAGVRLLELETLREILGKSPRLSQRLEIGWSRLPRADGLKDWIGQFETGGSTLIANKVWLSAMGGLSVSEGSLGPVRPLGSLRLTLPTEKISATAAFVSTGASSEGVELGASLRLFKGCELSTKLIKAKNDPSWLGIGAQFRF